MHIIDQALTAWSIRQPWSIEPTSMGTNNLNAVVSCPDGKFVLRISQNTRDSDGVVGVHTLLTQLAVMNLSFQVPVPIPARNGATVVPIPGDGGGLASLCQVIPGIHPDPWNLPQTTLCGAAIAELHEALAHIELTSTIDTPHQMGNLAGVHPLVPDPLQFIASLPNEPLIRERIIEFLDHLERTVNSLSASGHSQLIHGDLYPSNMLVQDGRVSGILDFEFVLTGPPVMDVAIGLHAFAIFRRMERDPFPVMRAFIEGYRRVRPLAEDDLRALSTYVLLREMVSLLHRGGRWRQGLSTEEDVTWRAIALVDLADWVSGQPPDFGLR